MARREGTKVITGVCRLSYLHVFEPYAHDATQDPAYSVQVLIPKTEKQTIRLLQEAEAEAIDNGVQTKWGGKTPKKLKLPLRDGDEEKEEEEYQEMFFLNAKSKAKNRPKVLDVHKEELFEGEIKSGDWGKLSLTLYPFSVNGNNGIGVGLNHILKVRDGDPLGGSRAAAETDFDGEFEDEDGLLD